MDCGPLDNSGLFGWIDSLLPYSIATLTGQLDTSKTLVEGCVWTKQQSRAKIISYAINPENILLSTETILIQGKQSNTNMLLQKSTKTKINQNIIWGPEANKCICFILEAKLV